MVHLQKPAGCFWALRALLKDINENVCGVLANIYQEFFLSFASPANSSCRKNGAGEAL